MDGPSPPLVSDIYHQSQSHNMNSSPSHYFVSAPILTSSDQYRSQSDMDSSGKGPASNGMRSPPPRHLSSPQARHMSPLTSQKRTAPWAEVVMGPNASPSTIGTPQQFLRSLLLPHHQNSPRASLEDLIATEPLSQDDHVSPLDDSDEGEEDLDTLSISSSIYRGQVEHGRRYARDTDYIAPSDEKQFESMQAGHLMYTILDSQRPNPFFRSPIPEEGHHHIMDVGTGDGAWAMDVADTFENYTVHGVDLYPPPQDWIPPNVLFEVDDLSKPWIDYGHKFSLIHIRLLLAAFSSVGWDRLYAEAYKHLEPGGWLEHLECDIDIRCEDGSLPSNSQLITFGRVANDCANEMGCPLTIYHEMRARIERAGFVNIQEKVFKAPIGAWPRNTTYKDAGKCSLKHFKTGMSGWLLRLLTKYGNPDPWEPNKAQIWLAVLKRELDAGPEAILSCWNRDLQSKVVESRDSIHGTLKGDVMSPGAMSTGRVLKKRIVGVFTKPEDVQAREPSRWLSIGNYPFREAV